MNPTGTAQEVERVDDEMLKQFAVAEDYGYLRYDYARSMARELQRLRAASDEGQKMLDAINWACGCGHEDFCPSAGDEAMGKVPRFWWRAHLTERAGLAYDRFLLRFVPSPPSEAPGKDGK